jgi:hypothetical protein
MTVVVWPYLLRSNLDRSKLGGTLSHADPCTISFSPTPTPRLTHFRPASTRLLSAQRPTTTGAATAIHPPPRMPLPPARLPAHHRRSPATRRSRRRLCSSTPCVRCSEEELASYFVQQPPTASACAHAREEMTSYFVPRQPDPRLLDVAQAPFLGGRTPGSSMLPLAPTPRRRLLQVSPLVVNARDSRAPPIFWLAYPVIIGLQS